VTRFAIAPLTNPAIGGQLRLDVLRLPPLAVRRPDEDPPDEPERLRPLLRVLPLARPPLLRSPLAREPLRLLAALPRPLLAPRLRLCPRLRDADEPFDPDDDRDDPDDDCRDFVERDDDRRDFVERSAWRLKR
jgi:hypothetical protein